MACLIVSEAPSLLMVPWLTSGYWVDEWLPQMMTFFTASTFKPNRAAICQEYETKFNLAGIIDGVHSLQKICRPILGNIRPLKSYFVHSRSNLQHFAPNICRTGYAIDHHWVLKRMKGRTILSTHIFHHFHECTNCIKKFSYHLLPLKRV